MKHLLIILVILMIVLTILSAFKSVQMNIQNEHFDNFIFGKAIHGFGGTGGGYAMGSFRLTDSSSNSSGSTTFDDAQQGACVIAPPTSGLADIIPSRSQPTLTDIVTASLQSPSPVPYTNT
jgi:hypothetical protein